MNESPKYAFLASILFTKSFGDPWAKILQFDNIIAESTQKSKSLAEAFGKDVIESYIKLKNSEIKDFKSKSTFNKKKPVTKWEKDNTLDC